MKSGFGSVLATSLVLLLFGSLEAAQQATTTSPSAGDIAVTAPADTQSPTPSATNAASKVRIVRLSQIAGDVKVDRGTGEGYETPLLNLPITEGSRLRTGEGTAEVEFEDNSTLRLTPGTWIVFAQLRRTPSGTTLSTIGVTAGMVFVDLARTSGNEFALAFDNSKVSLAPSSHVRLDVVPLTASLALLKGSARVDTPAGVTTVGKKETLNFAVATPGQFTTSKNVENPYDAWDENAIKYHTRRVNSAAYGNSGNLSGLSDMNYYGRFVNAGGCGTVWRPYFANAAWDPFYQGSWVWYPNWGWTWVSPYPWGWSPYHSGSWDYCPTAGWGWRPRGRWVGLSNHPKPGPHPPVFGLRPVPPLPRPPHLGEPTTIRLHEPKAIVSGPAAGQFTVRQNSAGLGIPRESFGNLNHISGRLEQHGLSSVAVHSPSIGTSIGAGHPMSTLSGRGWEGATRASGSGSSGGGSRSSFSGGPGHSSSWSSSGGWGGGSSSGSRGGGGGAGGGGGGGGRR